MEKQPEKDEKVPRGSCRGAEKGVGEVGAGPMTQGGVRGAGPGDSGSVSGTPRDADGEEDLLVGVLPAAAGVHPRRAHEIQTSGDGVQEQPHVFHDEGAPGGGPVLLFCG